MSNAKRKELAGTGRGTVGKAAMAGVKDRDSNKAAARVMEATDAGALQGFVRDNARPGATLHADEAKACQGMPESDHEAVNHSMAEHVRGMAHMLGYGKLPEQVAARPRRNLPQALAQAPSAACR